MNRFNTLLLALLIIQLVLTAFMFSGNNENAVYQSGDSFIDIQLDSLDEISITDAGQKVVNLRKQDQQWLLPDYFDVAVSDTKLKRVIESLSAIKTGWPVARTETSAPRFKVDEEKFEKRIDFKLQGKVVETLYLGSSPGFRKVHTRKSGDNAIYNVEFSTYELSTQNKDWMSKDLLKQDTTQLNRVKVNDLELSHTGEHWQLAGLSAQQQTVSDAAKGLINKLSNLTYTEIVDTTEQAEFGLKTPDLIVELSHKSGEVTQLKFAKSDDDDYFGQSSAQPYYFNISHYSLKPILDINRERLVTKQAPKTTSEPSQNPETPDPFE